MDKDLVDDYKGEGIPPHSDIVVTVDSPQGTPPDLNMAVQAKPPNKIQLHVERKAENPPSPTPSSNTDQHV